MFDLNEDRGLTLQNPEAGEDGQIEGSRLLQRLTVALDEASYRELLRAGRVREALTARLYHELAGLEPHAESLP